MSASDHELRRLRVETVIEVETAIMLGLERAGIEMQVQALQIFRSRHVERHIEALQQEAGRADVIGMEVRSDDARQRPIGQQSLKQRLPSGLGLFVAETGVDQCPAVTVIDKVEIDVVKEERQRHSRPQDPWSDFDRVAGRGRHGLGEHELCARNIRRCGRRLHSVCAHDTREEPQQVRWGDNIRRHP